MGFLGPGFITLSSQGAPVEQLGGAGSGLLFDNDATLEASYPGSGDDFLNSLGTTEFDLRLGNATGPDDDDPGFVGPAGDPGAYLDWTTGDKSVTIAANAPFHEGLHKDAGDYWLTVAFQSGITALNTGCLWSTGAQSGTAEGIELLIGTTGNASGITTRINIRRNGATRTVNDFSSSFYAQGSDYLLTIVYDSTTDTATMYKNADAPITSGDLNTGVGGLAPAGLFTFGMRHTDGGQKMAINTRLYGIYGGNVNIGADIAAQIRSDLEARHDRLYTAA